jgi:hypothetical protein
MAADVLAGYYAHGVRRFACRTDPETDRQIDTHATTTTLGSRA